MNMLRYEDIEAAVRAGTLLTNTTNESIQAASYDLRVGTIFRDGQIINEDHPDKAKQFLIQPGELISIFTLEEVRVPANMAGLAFPINKLSSQGLLVLNPGHIDPGYEGPLTVKAINLRKTPISISRGQPIFTAVFLSLGAATTHPYARNQPDRRAREEAFHSTEVERMPGSLAKLLGASKDLPVVSEEAMNRAIRKHWMSLLTLVLTAVAAATGVIAVVSSGAPPGAPVTPITRQQPAESAGKDTLPH